MHHIPSAYEIYLAQHRNCFAHLSSSNYTDSLYLSWLTTAGVFGGLDLHGFEVKPVITHLAATVEKGDSVITVDADVEASGWNVSHSVVFIIL